MLFRDPLRVAAAAAAMLLLALALPARSDANARFKIIAHPSCPARALSRERAARIFLGKETDWGNGQRIEPIDQREGTPVRASFTTTVLQRSPGAVRVHWQQAVFSGRGVPPTELPSDEAVIAAVREREGAIGYVSADARVDGVKVLELPE